ncbi:MAG: SH3 domain-containing protein [Chloroflexota bacterium]
MKLYRGIAYFLILLSFTTILAQEVVCGAVVERALDAVGQSCTALARNRACYGYVSLQATAREGAENFSFTQKGDLVSVADIDTLRLSRYDAAANSWGIALMKLQANLPNSLPGQNVSFLIFGDVQVQNAGGGASPATVQVSVKSNANIRSTPSTSGTVIGSFAKGDTTTADGRTSDGSWLRIQLPDSDALGWVFASLVTVTGDAAALAVVDSTQAETVYTPMQAFYFQSGIAQIGCKEVPQDGILIQTPKGAGQVNLRANDVEIQLGSTAYLQAQPNGAMTISVVEGEGHITAQGVTVAVPAGTFATIPMDANMRASGSPTDAKPYDLTQVEALPVRVLPEVIAIAPPALEVTPEATESLSGSGGTTAGGAYSVQKVMDKQEELFSGTVCSLDQSFIVHGATPGEEFDIHFMPDDATQGSWAYDYTSSNGTGHASGTYTISDAAADGSRRLIIIGQTYEFGLVPTTSC